MSSIIQSKNSVKWTIRDTEFLLRLISTSNISGSDVEQAADAIKKIKEIHSKLLSNNSE